jgi:hypothetical protein
MLSLGSLAIFFSLFHLSCSLLAALLCTKPHHSTTVQQVVQPDGSVTAADDRVVANRRGVKRQFLLVPAARVHAGTR